MNPSPALDVDGRRRHPRWGWKMAHRLLVREGWKINRKRVRRLWRQEGLRRPPACRRKRHRPEHGGELFRAVRPNHVWALDFQFDETADGRRLNLLQHPAMPVAGLLWQARLIR
ncbi:MAG: IS3 family transposase [Actinobacteria bacterium]|nr:IS3 family transposase [Actinomycetota bacterium]